MRTLAPAPADKQTPIAPAAGISAPIAVIPGRLIAITRPVMVCDIISHFVSCEHRLSLFGFLSLVRPKHRKQEHRKCPARRSKEDQCDDYEEKIHHRLSLVSEHQVSRRRIQGHPGITLTAADESSYHDGSPHARSHLVTDPAKVRFRLPAVHHYQARNRCRPHACRALPPVRQPPGRNSSTARRAIVR
jgi:hypothetical protein